MAKIAVYNLEGKKLEDMEVSDAVFGVASNNDLLHQVYVTISANRRQVLAHTKDKSERAGSGKKPWRQKGTGNARVGLKRNPVWRGGGIAFGPTSDRNFAQKVNKKMRQKAVVVALTEKLKSKQLIVVENMKLAQQKTKEFAKAVSNLKIGTSSTLVGLADAEKDVRQYSRNIENVSNVLTKNLNVFDMLNHKYLLLSKDSLKYLEEKFQEKK